MDDNKKNLNSTLELIISATGIGLWDWELNTGKVIYSSGWEAIAGYDSGELEQTVESWINLVIPEDMPKVDEIINDHIINKTPYYSAEFRMRRKDGEIIWAQDKGLVVERDEAGNALRIVGVIQNITKLKETENELITKKDQLDFVAKLTNLGLWDWNIVNNHIDYNDEYLQTLGLSQFEVSGSIEEWESLIHPDDREKAKGKLNSYLSGISDSYSCELRIKHKDGHYIWLTDVGKIVEWDHGAPTRVWGGYLNINHLKLTEESLHKALADIEKYNNELNRKVEQGIADLHQANEYSRSLYDANPQVNFIFSDKFELLDGNPQAISFYGFSDKQDLKDNFISKVKSLIAPYMPDGRPSISLEKRLMIAASEGEHNFETHLMYNGNFEPFDFHMKRIKYHDSWAIAVYQYDMRELKSAQRILERQDNLLKTTNIVAERLMAASSERFFEELCDCLSLLGKEADVDRVYIWKNFIKNNELYCSQIYEWSEGAEPQQGNEYTIDIAYKESIPTWTSPLSQNTCINSLVKDMLPEEIAQLEPQEIKSILIAPLHMHNEFWGFIGFDDCHKERKFTLAEEGILQSAGLMFMSALHRHEINENLIKAKDEALSSAMAKSTFLANMSHEIRTPINAIIGMTTIAKNSESRKKVDECLDKLSIASMHLLRLINDVLDMSKIQADKLELFYESFHFRTMIQNVYSIVQTKINEKYLNFNIYISEDVPQNLISDELRLSQVITNLLSNAIKFTPNHGEITLNIQQVSKKDSLSELLFTITDNGIGIPKEQQKNLFVAFEQAEIGTSKKFGGTGLGLAISKSIVEKIGGAFHVQSEVGKGSTFAFNIFAQISDEVYDDTLEDTNLENYSFKGKTILLVEDIEINMEIIIAFLEDTGVNILCAENGLIGYEMYIKNQDTINAILMDIQMPVLDGLSATEKIRAIGTKMAHKVPIIAMTANAFSEDVTKCIVAGMNDHIAKPIDVVLLLKTLKKYI